jgi:orotate phosphoribosyltransferase
VPWCFNRKEAKDHGEGGALVGAAPAGEVLIVDDVISAGLSIGESVNHILAAGARPAGVFVALNRKEKGGESGLSAAREVEQRHGLRVYSIVDLHDLMQFLAQRQDHEQLAAIQGYYDNYGAD